MTKDLGYANGWEDTPEIVEQCEAEGHSQYKQGVGRCLMEYGCWICDYKYLVDSSD